MGPKEQSHSCLLLASLSSAGTNGRDPKEAHCVQDVEGEPPTLVHSCFF